MNQRTNVTAGGNDTDEDEGGRRGFHRTGRLTGGDGRRDKADKPRRSAHGLKSLADLTGITPTLVEVTPPVPQTVQEAAQQLQATGFFSAFVIAGPGAVLMAGNVLFEYVIGQDWQKQDEHRAKVIMTEDPRVPFGFYVPLAKVKEISEGPGGRYFPRAPSAADKRPVDRDLENRRTATYGVLIAAITAEGGPEAVNKKVAEHFGAADIKSQIAAGGLKLSLADVLDDTMAVEFGGMVGDKPMVFQTGFHSVGRNKPPVHCIVLAQAPLGIDGIYQLGTYVRTGQLFDTEHKNPQAGEMISAVLSCFTQEEVDAARDLIAQQKANSMAPDDKSERQDEAPAAVPAEATAG